jgi:3-keto-5-aminohexanoate cleavage enzyme
MKNMQKLIVTVAPTGSVPKKENNPHVPITPTEIIAVGKRCEAAGAAIIHVHARNPVDQSASTDYGIFREIYQGLKSETNLIIQISTGGRAGMDYAQRNQRLNLRPEMASLTTGSVNFPNSVYVNSPELIENLAADMQRLGIKPEMEIFDVSMIANALALAKKGRVRAPLHFDFVMGLTGAIPATAENLMHLRRSIPADATWTATGIGAAQLSMNTLAVVMGGHVRVGLEDALYYRKGELGSNERMVERIVRIGRELGREPASPDEARDMLALPRNRSHAILESA